ncbi:MFS family permease [Streptacidiphilus sp. BW17]|uniref:MFS transporter n=1 Tax=unclassified Streptacidiphilus TaxID=2643834 RepID=UPI0035158D13
MTTSGDPANLAAQAADDPEPGMERDVRRRIRLRGPLGLMAAHGAPATSGAFAPLRHRDFRVFLAARILSASGTAIAPLALAFGGLAIGGASSLGWILAAGALPQVLLTLVGGVAGDRYPRHLVMAASNLLLGAGQSAAAVLLLTHTASVGRLAMLSALSGAASAFLSPAMSGTVPSLVPAEALRQANALHQGSINAVKIAGPAVGGALIAAIGPGWGLAYDAVTFYGAAALVLRLHLPATAAERTTAWRQLREGWTVFASHRWLWAMTIQGTLIVAAWLAGYVLLGPVYAQQHLHGPADWGLVISGFTIGLVTGAAACLLRSPNRPGLAEVASAATMALPMAAMATHAPLPLLIAATFTAGAALNISMISWRTLLPQRIPAHQLGRISAFSEVGQLTLVPLAYLAAGLAGTASLARALWAITAVLILAAVGPLLLPDVRALALADNLTPPSTADHGTAPEAAVAKTFERNS